MSDWRRRCIGENGCWFEGPASEFEKGPRLIRVDRLKVHQDLNKPGSLSVTLEIAAYEPADGA